MTRSSKQEAGMNALRMIPTKWAIAIVVALIGYVLLQPKLNQWFGWNLPSVASMVGDEKKTATKANLEKDKEKGKSEATKSNKKVLPDDGSLDAGEPEPSKEKPSQKTTKDTRSQESEEAEEDVALATEKASVRNRTRKSDATEKDGDAKRVSDDSDKTYGYLTDLGRNRFESPEGLVYESGSGEGHRLKHIARHLEDQPNRPGSHGVFKGDMKAFLIAIDDGYARAKRGAKGTKKTEEDDSIVYEASFEKAIGFLGGQEGGRKRKPPLKRLRIVVRGNSVTTAFPF